MKYVVILCDGMADYPIDSLGNKTPLEVAKKENMNMLCAKGEIGLVKTVPDGMKPGSDVANLAVMGYAPAKYYSGRSPLEALSIGIDLVDGDIATRCNLVTVSDEPKYENKTMVDYSAGEISTSEAHELVDHVQQNLGDNNIKFYAGVSYRHCLVAHNAELGTIYTPPHDISGKCVGSYLPKGLYSDKMKALMLASYELLKSHPINLKRKAEGKNPANSIWLWGEGTKPQLDSFEDKYGKRGGVISAVDLIKGIGTGAHMQVIEVEGATGTYKTNFAGKAQAVIDSLKGGLDYIYLHMEAPDECGHQGDLKHKIEAIELIDKVVVKKIVDELTKAKIDFSILLAPDHPTPIALMTHTSDPVPYILYRSNDEKNSGFAEFNEKTAGQSGNYFDDCQKLVDKFIKEA